MPKQKAILCLKKVLKTARSGEKAELFPTNENRFLFFLNKNAITGSDLIWYFVYINN
jgi:hypothetical protein